MIIGIDAMGGDFAPYSTVQGAILARKILPKDVSIVLIGDKDKILSVFKQKNYSSNEFNIIHASEIITMDEQPARAFSEKKNASIVVGYQVLKQGKIDAFASAGNTGAMLVGAMQIIKSIPGIIRPSITVNIPKLNRKPATLLDVGINPDCKPEVLYQYAILGSIYARYIYNINEPKVALLNIGAEQEKGNLLTQSAYKLMKNSREFIFCGNIEPNYIFTDDKIDVIVCDGFTGNIVLKEAEGFYTLLKIRNINDPFFEKFNYENYGGTPILGINSNVIIGHGKSNPNTIKNMILQTKNVINAKLIDKFKNIFK